MAYFSLGQLLTNIDGNKKAYNQANYVLSEGGLWIPMRASNAGEVFAQLTGSIPAIKKSIKTLNHSITGANIPAEGTNLLTITPPVGELWRALQLNITISPPAGATTGEHSLEAYLYSFVSVPFFRVISNYDKYISIAFNRPSSSHSKSFLPDSTPEFMSQIKGIKFTNNIPLNLLYKNNTDAPQENLTIGVNCYWEVEYIG